MKRFHWIVLLLIGALFLAGCQTATVAAESDAAPEPQPAEVIGLAGTSWLLSSLDGSLPVPGAPVTMNLDADGTVSGSDGCNRFNTSFVQDGESLTFAQPGASTMMACDASIMNQATQLSDALAATSTFVASEDQLILMDGNQILATFVTLSQDLAGTTWEVTGFNNGRDAVVSPLLGTEITAKFDVDGTVSGNAGCNEYFAGFSVTSDGGVSIDVPGTTFRFCESPAGVMEQEAEFLAALASAATYSVDGDMLWLRTEEDQIAAIMTRRLIVDLPQPDPAVPWGRVTAPAGVNVRSGPGVNFPVLGNAQFGDEGEIIGRDANRTWWAVSVPSLPDGVGWVSADFVLATDAEDVPVIEVAPPPVAVPPTPAPPTPTPVPAATATPTAQISFSVEPTAIDQGQCATLRWNAQNVQAVWVYPQGEPFNRSPRALQGSERVCPPVTTTYEMRVQRRDGATEFREVMLTVRPSVEPQIAFWADSTDIQRGDCTRLHWDVQNVQAVWVYPQGRPHELYPRVGRDSERVCPTTTTTYEMRVQLRDGSTVFRRITINVADPAPPAPSNPLAGSRWTVTQFNNGAGISTLIDGTRITMEFGAGDQITGNSGCNTFSATYQVNGNRLSISPLAGGMMNCTEPDGVMQQEAEFQTALPTAATFRVDGNRLEIQNGANQILVTANRAQ